MKSEHDVLIAGGGPTGLMLAGELALAGVDVAIVERRTSQDLVGMRALGLHARSIEVLDQRGIADRFLSRGKTYPVVHFADVSLDISDLPTRHNYVLGLAQVHIEGILAGWIGELGVQTYRGVDVTGFEQHDARVSVTLSDGATLRAQYLVGCDGGRSLVRKATGIDFAGWDATMSWLIADAESAEEPAVGIHHDARGFYALSRSEDGKRIRLVVGEKQVGPASEPTLQDVSEALVAVCGTDYGIRSPVWISRFTDMARQAVSYRDRRVLLAGDAAHVHSPVGGQGLNTGIQDAANLGWKLAQVVKQMSPESLLDTYHAERHPVGAAVLRTNRAQMLLRDRADDRVNAIREIVAEPLRMDEPRKRIGAMMSALDIRYDLGDGHPLVGRRVPDIDLATTDVPARLFDLLHDGRPVLLNLGGPWRIDINRWADRVRMVDADYGGAWELPGVGEVDAPRAVLIRPDGHAAWVGDESGDGLAKALSTWFGPPPPM